jgi:hypothetical protein
MKVILDYYYDDLEQRCSNPDCDFVVGPYSEEWHGGCPQYKCGGHLLFYRAFGTVEQRSQPVQRWQARISGVDY